jgi:hypothetical protein
LLPPSPTPSGDGDESDGDDGSAVFQKCGVSESARSIAFMTVLSTVSQSDALMDTASSRYQAMNWLVNEDAATICPGNDARVIQRYIAALIYFQLGGDSWSNCRADGGSCFQEDSTSVPAIPFLSESSECIWFGLTCANTPREVTPDQSDIIAVEDYSPIVSVDISDNSLSGDLFTELFVLTELQELTLDGNKGITGRIPEEIGQLTNLIALDIDDNVCFVLLAKFNVHYWHCRPSSNPHFSFTQSLTGTLPQNLYSLTTLEAIDLNENQLSGTISNDIGNLPRLVVVQLDSNNLTGKEILRPVCVCITYVQWKEGN